VIAGKPRSVARAITMVESASPERDELLERLRRGMPDEGHIGTSRPGLPSRVFPRVIGITGPPGAGKSSIISGLIPIARELGEKVAVLAVDPSSPFSGGALLGDRLRMDRHGTDPGVFIRSMASRGRTGGLAPSALETVTVLTAAGFDTIIVESVGVGQSEVGILTLADVVLVVLNPGTGDDIQALKAGVMEIGDVYVVNKADYPEAEGLARTVQNVLSESHRKTLEPMVLRTTATTGEGLQELYRGVDRRLCELLDNGELQERHQERITAALQETAGDLFNEWVGSWIAESGWSDARGGVPFAALRRELSAALQSLTDRIEHKGEDNDSRN
jgi:LAO/AO transport system kinase